MSSSAVKPDEKNPTPNEVHPADEFDDSTGGERTVAQPFEGFELDPSVPLPISVPPPAMPKEPPKTTGTQRMPPTPARPVPRPPVASPPGKPSAPRIPLPPPPSARMPVAPKQQEVSRDSQPSVTTQLPVHASAQGESFDDDDDPVNDGPTMATAPGSVDFMGASAIPAPSPAPDEAKPRKSPLAATGFSPMPNKPAPMADVETIARLQPEPGEQEETTRAVSRDELFRAQDAHVVVGDDAIGDEATLAVPPEKLEAMKATGPMPETPKKEAAPAFPPPPTPFSGAPGFSPLAQAPMPMPGAAPQSWPQQQAVDPAFRQPGSGPQQIPGAPFAHARNAQQAITGPAMHQQQQMHPAQPQAVWPPPPPQPQQPKAATKVTPQILALVGVGIVCLLIFFVGIYLFVTTNF